MAEESSRDDQPQALTSFHVRRARSGDELSLTWLVERISPLLRAAAEYRLGRTLRALYDPEDIVHDVWVTVLPRLHELPSRDERYTPVLLKFLSSTLRFRISNLIQKHISGKPVRQLASEERDPLDEAVAHTTDIVHRAARNEVCRLIAAGLERLEPRDQEIIVLRGIEQHPYQEIAAVLGADAKVLAVRYQRALEKLRRELPGSVYDELGDD